MQKPIKARLLIVYGSCSVFICTIEPQEVRCPFYLGIGSYLFTFCELIQTYPSFKNAVVSTNTQVWFFSHTLYKRDASPLLFIFLKTFRVVTHCVIDATFKIISSARALSSNRSENYCFSNCACESDCHLNLVTELRSETGKKVKTLWILARIYCLTCAFFILRSDVKVRTTVLNFWLVCCCFFLFSKVQNENSHPLQ